MIDNQEVTVYKFAVTWNCTVEPITPLDISIYTLNKMETSLLKSVENIESDINQTDTLVRQYIRDKKRQLAKNFLRKKHVLEKNLGKFQIDFRLKIGVIPQYSLVLNPLIFCCCFR